MASDRDKLLLEVLLELGGKKNKREDWIKIATKVRKLIDQYPSVEILASKLQVSPHVVRSIASLLDLPAEVKTLIRERKILYDAAYRLHTLSSPARQVEVARVIQGLTSHTQRAAIQYARGHELAELEAFVVRLKSPKIQGHRTHLVVVPVPEDEMAQLKRYCQSYRLSVVQAVGVAIRALINQPEKT
jgi:hypothetical protein